MFPDRGLERLLRLVQALSLKIVDIDQAGFLDASVLGEAVHPRNFNTLRRISDEDGTVIEAPIKRLLEDKVDKAMPLIRRAFVDVMNRKRRIKNDSCEGPQVI